MPRILRQGLYFARIAHAHSVSLGYSADVHGKSAWEVPVPSTYRQATSGIHAQAWQASMRRELENPQTRGIWREGYGPILGVRAIATRWIYNVKASLLFKSRLVARGDQRPNSIFEPASDSPTVARSSLNVLLAA